RIHTKNRQPPNIRAGDFFSEYRLGFTFLVGFSALPAPICLNGGTDRRTTRSVRYPCIIRSGDAEGICRMFPVSHIPSCLPSPAHRQERQRLRCLTFC